MTRSRLLLVALVLLFVVPALLADAPGVYAITGGTVHTASGADIPNGVVIVRDGLIEAVGANIAVPSDADTPHPNQRFVTCSAGSAIAFNGHLLHSGSRNASNETRHALQLTFARHSARITGTGRIENATLERVGDAAFLFL